MLKGLLASGITMGVAAVFPQALVFPFYVGILGLVAGVYPGLAMVDDEEGHPAAEWVAAVVILTVGLVGLWGSPLLLSGAFLAHGFWSLLHPLTALGKGTPEAYPRFCVSYDLVATCFIVYMWSVGA